MIPDRSEAAFKAHRDALTEIHDNGENYDRVLVVEAMITLNEWRSGEQGARLIGEILYAADAGELDEELQRSLVSTISYLTSETEGQK